MRSNESEQESGLQIASEREKKGEAATAKTSHRWAAARCAAPAGLYQNKEGGDEKKKRKEGGRKKVEKMASASSRVIASASSQTRRNEQKSKRQMNGGEGPGSAKGLSRKERE